jgi:hypothetical protein
MVAVSGSMRVSVLLCAQSPSQQWTLVINTAGERQWLAYIQNLCICNTKSMT